MKTRTLKGCLAASALAVAIVPFAATAQPTTKPPAYAGALTPGGVPDLEGAWTNVTMTDFERPATFGERLVLTPKEVAEAEGEVARVTELANSPTDPNATVHDLPVDCSGGRSSCNYNAAWTEPGSKMMRVGGEPRTSIITTPSNGRIPYSEDGKKRAGTRRAMGADNPENRSTAERCLDSSSLRQGVMTSTLYNNNYQFSQSPDAVAITMEMSHDARIVRLNSKHRTDGVRPWFGDSIGWYEGPTLVVETTNFHPMQVRAATDKLKVTERLTRIAKDRILYRFTVEDPATYSQPWGGEYEFVTSNGPLFEYACHEGNRGLEFILSGARLEEKQAAEGAPKGQPAAQ